MPVTPYLERARECADLADRAANAEDRKKLLEISEAWAELAKGAALEGSKKQAAKAAPAVSNRATWYVGQRVSRKDSQGLGTVAETDGHIKVKWDNGQTSYYRHGAEANVELEEWKP